MNIKSLIEEWNNVPHGQKGAFFERIEQDYGINKDKFHRERRKITGKLKTVEREKDHRKIFLAKRIAEMKERGKKRSDKPREMPTDVCINRLVKRGIMKEDEVSASHINYLLRTELKYREETPRVRWITEYALQEVQTDGSISKYFRPVKELPGGDVQLQASGRPLTYKGRDAGDKLILWQFLDKYSRLRTVRAFPGMAESTRIMAGHMRWWLNRESDDHLMKHLPWELAHDNGSIFKSEEYKNLARALNFTYRSSMPYEKTGIGMVENYWKRMWVLEMQWSEDYPNMFLSDYNELLHEALIDEHQEKHPDFDGKKGDVYQQSILRQDPRPRVLEVDIRDLMHESFIRTVTSELSVSVEGTKLRVPQHVNGYSMIGEKITVFKNWRGEWAASYDTDLGEVPFALREFEARTKGDFSGGFKKTFQQQLEDRGSEMYDRIMDGDIDMDNAEFDPETGEILESEPVKRLEPKKEVHHPETPFTPSEDVPSDQFANVYEAKVWIGKKVKVHGLTYNDVAPHFEERLEPTYKLEKERIGEAVEMFLDILTQKTKTA